MADEKKPKRKLKDEEQVVLMHSRMMYDAQKLRISSGNRNSKGLKGVKLSDVDKAYLKGIKKMLEDLENEAEKMTLAALQGIPIYERWLKQQKGVGPRLSGFLIGEIEISAAKYPSSIWRYFGLDVDIDENSKYYGRAVRRKKGEKSHFSPLKKAKVLNGLGDSLLKASPLFTNRWQTVEEDGKSKRVLRPEEEWIPIPREEWTPWRCLYEDYKFRKQTQKVTVCMGCEGTGKRTVSKNKFGETKDAAQISADHVDPKAKKVTKDCWNCKGTGGPAPWGHDDKHRHLASVRYMVKQFLMELHLNWRRIEGLPVHPSYYEAKHGREHKEDKLEVEYIFEDGEWKPGGRKR
jgi:hypothetical protein